VRAPISVGGIAVSDFLGLQAAWTDDFSTQSSPTQLYLWQPSFVVQPARTIAWQTFGTSFGADGYMHIRQLHLAYVSTADITLTCESYDGMSPAPITLPSSGGDYVKELFWLSANKGELYNFKAVSSAPFQIFLDDSEVEVGQWGREGPYLQAKKFGGPNVDASPI
jgi:hypothetical protein